MATKKLKPGTAGTAEGDRHAYTAILKIETLAAAMERCLESLTAETIGKMPEQEMLSELSMTVEMLDDQCDALRVALWGEGRSP